MTLLVTNGTVYLDHRFRKADLLISENYTSVFDAGKADAAAADRVIDCNGKYILPGFADVHVHFREPGFSYKETIRTGSRAAARGGYTAVCTMPNLKPVPSTMEGLNAQLDLIRRDACIDVIPYGAITRKQDGRSELSDMEAMAPYVCAFTDDGKGVQDGGLMRAAMETARGLGKMITAHCEDESLLGGSAIHDGIFAASIHHQGISSASEWKQIERDVKLADETGCPYHVCHVSTKESVEVIRDAKQSGVDVTCETGPHYLTLCDRDLFAIDPADPASGRFKMNPPLRGKDDRDALLAGLMDGTVDMIATDHAPHSREEKSKGLLHSAFGIVGLETAFPVLWTKLVETGLLTRERLAEVLSAAPRKRFGLEEGTSWVITDPSREFTIDPDTFESMGRSTPFEGWKVRGSVEMTIYRGSIVYQRS